MKTLMAKNETIQRKWYVADASGKVLGRFASRIAAILRGKHKTIFTPHVDTGDFVIVVNAEKIKLTGKKSEKKVYQSHSHYPGGFKEEKFEHLLNRAPEKVIIAAVQGMIPKTKLGDKIMKKLKVYKGPEHPHAAHKPEVLK